MKKRFWLVLLICPLQSKLQAFPEVLDKAIHYSFDVPIHLEKVINNKCYGIEDEPNRNLLITDCGGYLNVIFGTLTFGLIKSSKRVRDSYGVAVEIYLKGKSSECFIVSLTDLGGRIFEIEYDCKGYLKDDISTRIIED